MPYRAADGFTWETANYPVHARRVAAAIVLVMAGWATGFFVGRMSAWVFPVTKTDTAALDKSPPRVPVVAQTNAEPPSPPRVDEKQVAEPASPPTLALSPGGSQADRSESNDLAHAPDRGSQDDKLNQIPVDEGDTFEAPKQNAGNAERGSATTNSDWKQERSNVRRRERGLERHSAYDEGGFAECERRYASFRRSDGTYQPYGRISREVCPFLR